jgi:hypothetical protein
LLLFWGGCCCCWISDLDLFLVLKFLALKRDHQLIGEEWDHLPFYCVLYKSII